mmetsp:Transcript_25582/g.42256  ORF Transcript_25582/g.42256 Transcript_25582/m.42256 type:complete len:111 (-) Transcript_25582:81-413(-)
MEKGGIGGEAEEPLDIDEFEKIAEGCSMAFGGACSCGDGCTCIGCEIHQNLAAVAAIGTTGDPIPNCQEAQQEEHNTHSSENRKMMNPEEKATTTDVGSKSIASTCCSRS